MPALLRGDFVRPGYREISPRPEADIVGQSPAGTVQKVRDALDGCELHVHHRLQGWHGQDLFTW